MVQQCFGQAQNWTLALSLICCLLMSHSPFAFPQSSTRIRTQISNLTFLKARMSQQEAKSELHEGRPSLVELDVYW